MPFNYMVILAVILTYELKIIVSFAVRACMGFFHKSYVLMYNQFKVLPKQLLWLQIAKYLILQ